MKQNEDLKFIIHFDHDFSKEMSEQIGNHIKQQWESGIMVFPNTVCRVVIIDKHGDAKYEWTRPKEVIIGSPPKEEEKSWFKEEEKSWFSRLFS